VVDGTIDGVNDFNWVNEDEFVTALDLDVASDFEELDRWDDDRDWEFQEEYVAEAKAIVKKATEGLIASLEKRVEARLAKLARRRARLPAGRPGSTAAAAPAGAAGSASPSGGRGRGRRGASPGSASATASGGGSPKAASAPAAARRQQQPPESPARRAAQRQ
jgi:hypothetical protein